LKNIIIKIIKIAVGSTIAIIIANFFQLEYAVSAGLIVLLSIQDTKKATLQIAIKRFLAFIVTCFISFFVFAFFSFTPVAYGIYLLFFSLFCIFFKMQDALAMNAVLTTHFLLEKSMEMGLVVNEAYLLLIGAGIGIILNIYIPNNVKQIRKKQKEIEECLKLSLIDLAQRIVQTYEIKESISCKTSLKDHIKEGQEYAYVNMNNTFFQDSRYFISYMGMRRQQARVVKEMQEKANSLTMVTSQSHDISVFIRKVEGTFSESNNAEKLLEEGELLMEKMQQELLPITREEFETRAILYIILMNFNLFISLKKEFADTLTKEQKNKFWN